MTPHKTPYHHLDWIRSREHGWAARHSPISLSQHLHNSRALFNNQLWPRKLTLKTKLDQHSGCVNTINWNQTGSLLVSSGDDCDIAIWDSTDFRLQTVFATGHRGNVFCSTFVPYEDHRIVTCAADGQVRLADLTARTKTLLYRSNDGMAMKCKWLPQTSNTFLTTFEEGTVLLFDIRVTNEMAPTMSLEVGSSSCYSLDFDPLHPLQFAISTGDHIVQVYDLRTKKCVKRYSDPELIEKYGTKVNRRMGRIHATDVAYSSKGEMLINFSQHDLSLLDTFADVNEEGISCTRLQSYAGRRNRETFLKEACFLYNEQFITTGSDTGELFVWEKSSGKVVQKVFGDSVVVNGVCPHPCSLLLGVCGIDTDVKIFDVGEEITYDEDLELAQGCQTMDTSMQFRFRSRQNFEVVTEKECNERFSNAEEEKEKGNLHFRNKEYREAVACYESATELLNMHPPSARSLRKLQEVKKVVLLNRAACDLNLKNYAEAVVSATRALELPSSSPTQEVKGRFRRGKAYFKLKNYTKAAEDITLALQIASDSESRELMKLLRQIQQKVAERKEKDKKMYSRMFSNPDEDEDKMEDEDSESE